MTRRLKSVETAVKQAEVEKVCSNSIIVYGLKEGRKHSKEQFDEKFWHECSGAEGQIDTEKP